MKKTIKKRPVIIKKVSPAKKTVLRTGMKNGQPIDLAKLRKSTKGKIQIY